MNGKLPIVIALVFLFAIALGGAYFLFMPDDSAPKIGQASSSSTETPESSARQRQDAEKRASREARKPDAGTAKKQDSAVKDSADPTIPNRGTDNSGSELPDDRKTDTRDPKVRADGTIEGEAPLNNTVPAPIAEKIKTLEDLRHERLAELARLKIAENKTGESFVREAEFGVQSEEPIAGAQVARQRISSRNRRSGAVHQTLEASMRGTSRPVKGMVFEVRDGVRYPLADVLVTDFGDKHRTYTDAKGAFAFDAFFTDGQQSASSENRDSDPSNDRVYLLARADGYRMESQLDRENRQPGRMSFTGGHFMPVDYDTPEGAMIELFWHGSDTVKAKIMNPPPNPSVITIKLESYSGSSARADDALYLSRPADKNGEASFTFPPRRSLDITATGDGYSSEGVTTYNFETGFYEIKLKATTNIWVTGRVLDMRSGAAVPNARIFGYVSERESIYADENGNFAGWLPRSASGEINQLSVIVTHPDYAEARDDLGKTFGSNMVLTNGGSAPEGPWEIKLRPLVKFSANIITDRSIASEEDVSAVFVEGLMRHYMILRADAGATEIVELLAPWGMNEITFTTMATDDGGIYRRLKFFMKFGEGFWNNSDEYRAELTATING